MLYNIVRRVVYSTKYNLKKHLLLLIMFKLLTTYFFITLLISFLHILIITVKIPINIFLLTKTTLSVKHLFHLLVQLCYNRYLILTRGDVII